MRLKDRPKSYRRINPWPCVAELSAHGNWLIRIYTSAIKPTQISASLAVAFNSIKPIRANSTTTMKYLPGPTYPFFDFMQPPVDETPAQKTARLVSDAIDEEIKQERANMKKEKSVIRVLLLGQSESGE